MNSTTRTFKTFIVYLVQESPLPPLEEELQRDMFLVYY